MDRILLNDVALTLHLGVPEAERAVPQTVYADVELEFDTRAAGLADDFTLTIDYAAVQRAMAQVAASRPFALIESLAEEMAAAILAGFPAASVCIHIRKPAALREQGVGWAGVSIQRRRG
jgi:dihydroneopterin aldolase